MIVKKLFFICLLITTLMGYGQLKTFKFEQIDSLQKVEKRNIIVFFHTDWCKFCKAMKKSTLKNKQVIDMLNHKFYFISFDAENKKEVMFNNAIFQYKNNGISSGNHEIALALCLDNKQLNFPTICILNPKNEIIYRFAGFLNSKDLTKVLSNLDQSY